jgi:hypothetical protein
VNAPIADQRLLTAWVRELYNEAYERFLSHGGTHEQWLAMRPEERVRHVQDEA